MSKETGYGIRSEMLHLARDILAENFHARVELAQDKSKVIGFTTEDVLREAQKLYTFVNNKN